MRSRLIGLISTAGIAVLLALAVLVPARPPRARADAPRPRLDSAPCEELLEQGGAGATFDIPTNTGVCQPLGMMGNFAACSLGLQPPAYSFGRVDLVAWDPGALEPDPNFVAMRSRYFNNSALAINHVRMEFDPPFVSRSVPGVSEAPPAAVAIDYRVTGTYGQTIHYETDGAPQTPAALQFVFSSFVPRTPLPGEHPVLAHEICGGGGGLQDLYVIQSVMKSDEVIPSSTTAELAQRFRVPLPARVSWVEFAQQSGPYTTPYVPGVIGIYDAEGQSEPPMTPTAPIAQANFGGPYGLVPSWQSHYDFDVMPVLEPDHDYWLILRTDLDRTLLGRALTGGEGPLFTSQIGPLVRRADYTHPWSAPEPRVLNFRIVGEPIVAVAVEPPAARHAGPQLSISPRPSRGPVTIRWSAAGLPVRFEILDARGRRVARAESGGRASGEWRWTPSDGSGRALPAGVYFVHARESSGRTTTERLVLVR